eukprot:CAMPEP_0170268122 /NCGR_PEP_ID=MMETSP0116_2-20130129/33989_1 /TAXON_ID=400756 /ORGANISM="Durinskia baltica, Strain CSIRO CS-38" /LENGTH=172 /DNA_ID=CAMNT_0010519281 /DNA_START=64 /DNA_END=583 /DNA_ORIENTATION=+
MKLPPRRRTAVFLMAVAACAPRAISVVVAGGRRQAFLDKASVYHLAQYHGNFCTGTYVALELTLGMMQQILLPEGRSPEVLCNKLEKNATTGDFVVHSCPGDSMGCPLECDCDENLVKHFTVGHCAGGWILNEGPAPEDCTTATSSAQAKTRSTLALLGGAADGRRQAAHTL